MFLLRPLGLLGVGILALIAEFENDIRRKRQQDGINKAKAEGVRFGPKPLLTEQVVGKIKRLRAEETHGARDHAPQETLQGIRLPGSWIRVGIVTRYRLPETNGAPANNPLGG